MPPEETSARTSSPVSEDADSDQDNAPQYLYIIRHGDRWDYEHKNWSKTSPRPGDPPLSQLGHQQARETGLFLNELFQQDGIAVDDVTWLSSPFLRCLQTSNAALNALTLPDAQSISILPEYSVFEWDGKGGDWHASLPDLEERRHYFPRLAWQRPSWFIPPLPETREQFFDRCQQVMQTLHKHHAYRPKSVVVIVTHAAACIGLTQAATQCALSDINPATPCGLYRLTRTRNTPVWTMDACDCQTATAAGYNFNGHASHVSSLAGKTVAWNHFGDRRNSARGYTGPPTSPFAPPCVRADV